MRFGRLANDFFHDVAAGFFAGAVAAAWIVERKASRRGSAPFGGPAMTGMLAVLGRSPSRRGSGGCATTWITSSRNA